MARFARIDVARKIGEVGLVPVFYDRDPELCFAMIAACHRAGASVFEFLNRGDRAHETFSAVAARVDDELPEVILGAGSVPDAATAALYLQLGANFIVAPGLCAETGRVCNRRKVLWLPGCGSVTEIARAEELGAEIVKLFPAAEVGGPGFVKAVRAARPWTSVMPTGGVAPTAENLRAWFAAGVCSVGMGSQLIQRDAGGHYDLDAIERRTRDALAVIRDCR